MYFVFDPTNGFRTFPSLKEAENAAEESKELLEDEALYEGAWKDKGELIEQVCWGSVRQKVMLEIVETEDGEHFGFAELKNIN